MKKEMVISTPRINSYGSRILTEGIDTSQFEMNPILLWMHCRWDGYRCAPLPIGRVENLRREGNALIGTPVFDTSDEFALHIANKWESGILKMCSPGIEILETSRAPELVMPGQTRETITRCKLVEVSIVDIGANDDALQLHAPQAGVLTLSKGEACEILPLLDPAPAKARADETSKAEGGKPAASINPNKTKHHMKKETLQLLSLAEDATEEQVHEAVRLLKDSADRAQAMELAAVTSAVDQAVKDRRITEAKRDHFVELGKKVGLQQLTETLECMTSASKPLDLINKSTDSCQAPTGRQGTYARLSEVPDDMMETLKSEQPAEYARLYKAEYGIDLQMV